MALPRTARPSTHHTASLDRYWKATLANSAVAEQYGTGAADLLEYIFLVSEAIGCYDG